MDVVRTNHIKLPSADKVDREEGKTCAGEELWWWVIHSEKQRENRDKWAGTAHFQCGAILQGYSSVTTRLEYLACLGPNIPSNMDGLEGILGRTWPELQKKWSMRKAWQGGPGLI